MRRQLPRNRHDDGYAVCVALLIGAVGLLVGAFEGGGIAVAVLLALAIAPGWLFPDRPPWLLGAAAAVPQCIRLAAAVPELSLVLFALPASIAVSILFVALGQWLRSIRHGRPGDRTTA